MGAAEAVLGRLVVANNRRIAAFERGLPAVRSTDDLAWDASLVASWPLLRAEWDDFVASGGRLPLIDEVIDEPQGSDGPWRAGLLVSRGRPCGIAPMFPSTVEALMAVPGLRSALWSELAAGTELPDHRGPNAGVLRYHLGIRCGEAAGLRVGDVIVPYRDGATVLFDDTEPHAAWNRGTTPRVTLFCEIERPLPPALRRRNRGVQMMLALDPRYRGAPRRAAALDAHINGDREMARRRRPDCSP